MEMLSTDYKELLSEICKSRRAGTTRKISENEAQILSESLRFILSSFDSLRSHVALLEREFSAKFKYPLFRRDRPDDWIVSATKSFPVHGVLEEEAILRILDSTTSSLSNDELEALCVNPDALIDLFDIIDEVQPESWSESFRAVGEQMLSKIPAPPETPQLVSERSPSSPKIEVRKDRLQDKSAYFLVASTAASLMAAMFTWYAISSVSSMKSQLVALQEGQKFGSGESWIQKQSSDEEPVSNESLLAMCKVESPQNSLELLKESSIIVRELIDRLAKAGIPPTEQVGLIKNFLTSQQDSRSSLVKVRANASPKNKELIDLLRRSGLGDDRILQLIEGSKK
jgi:hypothetical protein